MNTTAGKRGHALSESLDLCNLAAVASLPDAATGLPNAPKDAIVGPPADERSTVSSVEEQDRLAWKRE